MHSAGAHLANEVTAQVWLFRSRERFEFLADVGNTLTQEDTLSQVKTLILLEHSVRHCEPRQCVLINIQLSFGEKKSDKGKKQIDKNVHILSLFKGLWYKCQSTLYTRMPWAFKAPGTENVTAS